MSANCPPSSERAPWSRESKAVSLTQSSTCTALNTSKLLVRYNCPFTLDTMVTIHFAQISPSRPQTSPRYDPITYRCCTYTHIGLEHLLHDARCCRESCRHHCGRVGHQGRAVTCWYRVGAVCCIIVCSTNQVWILWSAVLWIWLFFRRPPTILAHIRRLYRASANPESTLIAQVAVDRLSLRLSYQWMPVRRNL